MALTTGDKVGIVVGAGVIGFIAWELFKGGTGKEFSIYSAVDRRIYKGTNYNAVVNSAGGYNVTVGGKQYFIYTNGSGSQTPTATGKAYLWGSPLNNGEPAEVTLASIGYTPPANINYSAA